jgi:hypothetical protein
MQERCPSPQATYSILVMDLHALAGSAPPFLGPVRLVSAADVRLDVDAWNDRELRAALEDAGWSAGKRVAYVSTYDSRYIRTTTLLRRLRHIGVEPDLVMRRGNPLFLLSALPKLRRTHDVVIVGFRGHETLPFVRLCVGRKKGIVFDAFVSIADTLDDRGHVRRGGIAYRALLAIDRWLCGLADAVLVDTKAHAAFFRDVVRAGNVHAVYVESDVAADAAAGPEDGYVLWYGTCLPLHGLDKILRWAAELDGQERFTIVGPLRQEQRRFIDRLKPGTVRHLPWVDRDALPAMIAGARLCLGGPFGDSGKAKRVIAGKTWQMLACGGRVLIADTEGNRELFGG